MQDMWKTQKKIMNIGVFGLHPHAGATWITILLAEYLANICGHFVTIIEHSQKRDLSNIPAHIMELHSHRIKVLSDVNYEHINRDLKKQCCIYDLGCSYAKSRELIQGCDKVLFIFNLTPWYCDINRLESLLAREYGRDGDIVLIGNMISIKERKIVKSIIKHVEFIEYEPELFVPSKQIIKIFDHIIWEE